MVVWPHACGQNIMAVDYVVETALHFLVDRKQ
jgi:hypothetical protein